MEKVKLTKMASGKSGTTNGKSWEKLGIQVEEKGDTWINGFVNKTTQGWTVGSVVNLELEEDVRWGWQFKIPNATDNLEARVAVLEETVNALVRAVPSAGVEIKRMSSEPSPARAVVDKVEGQPEPVPPPDDDQDLPF